VVAGNRGFTLETLMSKPPTATKKPETVVAIESFAGATRTVHAGDVLNADDPVVTGNPDWFVPSDMPTHERPNRWTNAPAPPEQVPSPGFNVQVQDHGIPPHRQVKSKAHVWYPAKWAPGSPGEKRAAGPPPFGTAVKVGQIFDIGNPLVREHPERFEWPQRDVTIEDVERMSEE
jgi:hypothetical protein